MTQQTARQPLKTAASAMATRTNSCPNVVPIAKDDVFFHQKHRFPPKKTRSASFSITH